MTDNICPSCEDGYRTHGSALYDYYSCGHAYQKPLNSNEKGRMVFYKSKYPPYNKRY